MPRKSRGDGSRQMVEAARLLRRQPTPSERKLWSALRGRGVGGLKFRRQHVFGRFVLDAFCVEQQLAVEVDGSVHREPEQAAYDAERTAYLEAHGVRVLRFQAEEVEHNLPGVLNRIIAAAQQGT